MQIIQARTTQRQNALADALSEGLKSYTEASDQRALTKRQEALADQQTAFQLRQAGYDVTPEMVTQSRAQEPSGLAKFFGAKSPEKVDLYANRTQEWKDKQAADKFDREWKRENEVLDRQFKRSQIAKMGAEAQKTIAEAKNGPTPTEGQFKAAGFSKRARQAVADLNKLPSDIGTSVISDTLQGKSFFPDALKSENRKLYEQAKDNFISANLRKESGAAIGAEERAAEDRKYFPQPGDTPAVIAQKAQAREQAMLNLEAEGMNAVNRIATAPTVEPKKFGTTNTATASSGSGSPWTKYGKK